MSEETSVETVASWWSEPPLGEPVRVNVSFVETEVTGVSAVVTVCDYV